MSRALGLIGCVAVAACTATTPPVAVDRNAPPKQAFVAQPLEQQPESALSFDDANVEEVFLDPARIAKLRTAFPAIDRAVAQAQSDLKLPGVALGVIVDGELAHVSTAGYRDLESKAPVTADTRFRIGSVTKTVTSAAILKLRDEGKLSLDDPAAKYLPELRAVRYPTKDSPRITVRHLLLHTSGLPRQPRRKDERIAKNLPITVDEIRDALKGARLAFSPGSGWRYSNLGFTLLGLIVERAAKMSYRAYLEQRFFEPLGMRSAAWERAKLPAAHVAWPYEPSKAGAHRRVEQEEQLGRADASGGLYLSLKDLARWVGFNAAAYPARSSADSAPLARASLRELHGPSGTLYVGVGRPFTTPKAWPAEPWAGSPALGWDATALCDFDRLVEKGGFVERYQTTVGFFPNEGIGIVVMTNTGHVDELKRRTFFEVLGLLRQTGGVSRRVRIARHAPELDTALGRLLDVMNDWDEQKYLAMLTSEHKRNVPMPVEQAELAGYAKFHGRCESFELVRYDSSDHGRYRLNCERGTFEMELNLSDGLIAGFVGTSSDVSAEPEVVALAQAELARWSKLETNRKRHGRCTIGTLRNRDGNRWYRFAIGCERGPDSIAALRLKAEAPAATETFEVEPVGGGGCGLLAPG